MIPVDEDAGLIGARRPGDPVEQGGDLRLADPHDVDAAEQDPLAALLEGNRSRLQTPVPVPRRIMCLPDEADER